MKTKLITLLLLCFSLVAFAQTNDEQARQKYQEAKTAYDNKDYLNARTLLYKTRDLLGSTNIRIQPLLIKSLAKTNAWKYIKAEVNGYLALKPDTTLIEYREVIKISRDADANLKRDEAAYQETLNKTTNDSFDSYLTNFPYGLHRDDVNWEKARFTNTLEGYNQYLKLFPKGLHISEAKEGISAAENYYYELAESFKTKVHCQKYLDNYPNGKYKKEVEELLVISIEEDLYKEAKKNMATYTIQDYLEKYPNGKHVEELKILLGDANIAYADREFERGGYCYGRAADYYQYYLNAFPKGEKAAMIKEKIKLCKKLYKEYFDQHHNRY
jgi:hypothetical protein